MTQVDRVREQIVAYQEQGGYSDQQMADLIAISRPLYQRTRTGRVPVGGRFLKGALKLIEDSGAIAGRTAGVSRKTAETDISVTLNIDGTGRYNIATTVPMFDHLLAQLASHGLFDITLKASGDNEHHIVEDTGITLGQAFREAVGEKRGIVRMANATVPMDETLVTVALDLSGRGYAVVDLPLTGADLSGLGGDLVRHFLESFALEARLNLHVLVLRGTNDHHKAEAVFKALARCLDAATQLDPRRAGSLPTTKGTLF
jgi:imidazoleglycerol-phosphate dehydratase